MKPAIQFIPEGQYTTKELQEFAREFREYLKGKEVMHRQDAADFLNVSVRTVDRLVAEGHLPFHMLGTSKLFLRSEIITAIKNS